METRKFRGSVVAVALVTFAADFEAAFFLAASMLGSGFIPRKSFNSARLKPSNSLYSRTVNVLEALLLIALINAAPVNCSESRLFLIVKL